MLGKITIPPIIVGTLIAAFTYRGLKEKTSFVGWAAAMTAGLVLFGVVITWLTGMPWWWQR
jgi:hypothetical protein